MAYVPLNGGETIAVNITPLSGAPSTQVRLVVLGYVTAAAGSDYNPVNPCAAFDSRTGSDGFAGKRTAGDAETGTDPGSTTYNLTGVIPAAQGGEVDCGVPEGVSAVLVNLVAIQPEAVGNFRAYATGSTPTGGVVNFAALSPPMNNSNAVVVPVDGDGNIDLFVNAPNNVGTPTVHARGVILGYYN